MNSVHKYLTSAGFIVLWKFNIPSLLLLNYNLNLNVYSIIKETCYFSMHYTMHGSLGMYYVC